MKSAEQGSPGDLQELAAIVALRGPEMLAGHDPARVVLLAVHPRSPVCPDPRDEQSAYLAVAPRAEFERLAHNVCMSNPPASGVFWAILFGESQLAGLHLGPMGLERA